jgi:hypothetical protein
VAVPWLVLMSALVSAREPYGSAELLGHLEHGDIIESSGLAVSHRHGGPQGDLFWTHNDSGDEPRIFALDRTGRHRGTCRLIGAEAVDWEDLGSFALRGRPYLFVADVGDNLKKRDDCTIYLIDEPNLGETTTAARPLRFTYEDGPLDCEAVGLDTAQQVFILVEKVYDSRSSGRVYQLSWNSRPEDGRRVAKRIGSLPRGRLFLPWEAATGMDISPDGRRAVVATYGSKGLEYVRAADESWQDAFAKAPLEIVLPSPVDGRRLGESIAYGLDGVTLYLTSEKKPCPLFAIRPQGVASEP